MSSTPHDLRQQARDYLAAQFGAGNFSEPSELAHFDESPLEGEGPVSVLAFEASPGARPISAHDTGTASARKFDRPPDDKPSRVRKPANEPDVPSPAGESGSVTEAGLTPAGYSVSASCAGSSGGQIERYHVVVGQTEPNYYPAWGLEPEEVYNLHVGTRFMLVLEIAQAPLPDAPADLETEAAAMLGHVAPGEPLADFRPVAAFGVEDQTHVVARCRIGPEDVYLILGDLPPGIYCRTDLAPQVVYRMHLGQIIRMEADEE